MTPGALAHCVTEWVNTRNAGGNAERLYDCMAWLCNQGAIDEGYTQAPAYFEGARDDKFQTFIPTALHKARAFKLLKEQLNLIVEEESPSA